MRASLSFLLAAAAGAVSVESSRDSDIKTKHVNGVDVAAGAGDQIVFTAQPTADTISVPDAWSLDIWAELQAAVASMQEHFFSVSAGIWPKANDWTAAVMQTHLTALLKSQTERSRYNVWDKPSVDNLQTENQISRYLSDVTSYFHVQDAFGIRQQAHDDMLWVILGWLQGLRFAAVHDKLHYAETAEVSQIWYGTHLADAFAHRSHVFYDIVHNAWDKDLCGGGLSWDPHKEPYKNTVTNTQFISAAAEMYLHHPGDEDSSPFQSTLLYSAGMKLDLHNEEWGLPPLPPHDPAILQRAIEAHDWLHAVNMRDANGLYVDGYHVSPANRNHSSTPDQCDVRNDMLYTYNQGILLSGLHSLWEATGNGSYLEQGHELVRNVISATGWTGSLINNFAFGESDSDDQLIYESVEAELASEKTQNDLMNWHALGRGGILHEFCDATGTCSQDAQTFKGVFFHHFASFCKTLHTDHSQPEFVPGISHIASRPLASLHVNSCKQYTPWVARNANAALRTRDDNGLMGGWWGVDLEPAGVDSLENREMPAGATDVWPIEQDQNLSQNSSSQRTRHTKSTRSSGQDPNDRGRGRTVETQGSGLAVLRSLLELQRLFQAASSSF